MSKLAFVDKWGDLHSVVHRCSQEGHHVRYWIRATKPEYAKIGDGIVAKVHSLDALLTWRPDVVICYGSPDEYAKVRAERVPCWGSSAFTEQLEHDREFAHKIAEDAGLAVSQTEEFARLDDAYTFLAQTPIAGWVLKAEGKDQECSSTRVCPTREHVYLALDELKTKPEFAEARFVLQEIVRGTLVSCEGWYDYRVGWLRPFNSTLEIKRLMPGEPPSVPQPGVGPNTGAMGSVVWPWPGDEPRLAREVLLPFTALLHRNAVVAPFDVNSIIGYCSRCGRDHEGGVPHWLEFTPRLGWDAFEALMSGIPEGKLGNFLVAFGRGEATRVPVLTDPAFFASLRVLVKRVADVPFVAPWRANPHLFVKDVYADGTYLRSCGTDTDCGLTVVFELGRVGRDVYDATHPIYSRLVPNIVGADLIYRNDLGDQAERDARRLAELGYEVPGYGMHDAVPLAPATVYATPDRARLRSV